MFKVTIDQLAKSVTCSDVYNQKTRLPQLLHILEVALEVKLGLAALVESVELDLGNGYLMTCNVVSKADHRTKQKEAEDRVDSVQETTTFAAKEAATEHSLAMFKGWLLVRQELTEDRMNATTGKERAEKLGIFRRCAGALQELVIFEREARG